MVNIISNKNVPRLDFYWIYPCKKGVTSSRHAPLLFLTLKSWGKRQADGSFKPGDLAILRVLVLDQFMDAVRRGTLSSFPKAVVFFR